MVQEIKIIKKLGNIKILKRTWPVFLVEELPDGLWGLTDFFGCRIFIPIFDKKERPKIVGKQRLRQTIRHEVVHIVLERILPETRLDDKKGFVCTNDEIVEAILLLLDFWPQKQVDRMVEKAWKEIKKLREKDWRIKI